MPKPKMPRPIASAKEYRRSSRIRGVKKQAGYSLQAIAKRNNANKSLEDYFMIAGFVLYIALPYIAVLSGILWLANLTQVALFAGLFGPMVASLFQVYQLKDTLTLTLKIIPNDPNATEEVKLRLIDVRFDSHPLDTPPDLEKWMNDNKAQLVTVVKTPRLGKLWARGKDKNVDENAEIIKKVAEDKKKTKDKAKEIHKFAQNLNLEVWGAAVKGNKIKFMFLLPDDPRKWFKAKSEKVRLSYGTGNVPHATVWALEGDPITTSIKFEGTVIDVTFPLFMPFFTRGALTEWIKTGQFYIPGPIAERFAEYVRKKTDGNANEKYVKSLEDERDESDDAYDRLLLSDQFGRIQKDNEEGVTRDFKPKKGLSSGDLALLFFVAICAYISGHLFNPIVNQYLIDLGLLS